MRTLHAAELAAIGPASVEHVGVEQRRQTGTKLAQDGARHILSGESLYIGATAPDSSLDAANSEDATGDNNRDIDDEDILGSDFNHYVLGASGYSADVLVNNGTGAAAWLRDTLPDPTRGVACAGFCESSQTLVGDDLSIPAHVRRDHGASAGPRLGDGVAPALRPAG